MLQSPHIITLTVRSQDLSEVHVRIKDHFCVGRVFYAYAAAKKLDPKELHFLHDGQLLNAEWTCRDFELESGDVIDAMFIQGGD